MPKLSEFNVKFRKQITLRNELIPVGNTLFNIQKNKIISKDQELADKYEKAKLILDDFYRYFINTALSDIKLDWSDLADALLSNNGLKKIQSEKRKQIIDCFTKTSLEFENKFEKKEEKVKITYSDLFKGSELFKKKKIHNFIFQIYQNNEVFEKLEIIKAFENFSEASCIVVDKNEVSV